MTTLSEDLQRLVVNAEKAAARAGAAKEQVRVAKAELKKARKTAKSAKKLAKELRKRAAAAMTAKTPSVGSVKKTVRKTKTKPAAPAPGVEPPATTH